MDDVLASIRRIVRAGTEPEPVEAVEAAGTVESRPTDAPLAEVTPEQGPAAGENTPQTGLAAEVEAARKAGNDDEEQPEQGAPEQGPQKHEQTEQGQVKPADGSAPLLLTQEMRADRIMEREASAEPAAPIAALAPEREILHVLIAEILAAELRDGSVREILRDLIRDELTSGPLGENATQNVRAMIRAEIAAAQPERH